MYNPAAVQDNDTHKLICIKKDKYQDIAKELKKNFGT